MKNKALYHTIALSPLVLVIITSLLSPSFHNAGFLFTGLGVAAGIWMGTLESLPLFFWLGRTFFQK